VEEDQQSLLEEELQLPLFVLRIINVEVDAAIGTNK